MRTTASLLLLAVLLGGCAQIARFRAPPSPALSAPGPCGIQARQRLDDAIMSGNTEGSEKAVFDNAYQACLAAVEKYGQP